MKTFMYAQCSEEWWRVRAGIPTASNFDKIITPAKRQYSKSSRAYMYQLIAELTDPNPPWLSNRGGPPRSTAMQNGVDTEPEARRWYAMERGVDVLQVGFCMTDDGRFGCSPDGLVGEHGGLELKCPLLQTHYAYLDDGGIPLEYLPQVHGSLIVTGRSWWDFMSYAPGADPVLIRVVPNDFTEALRKCLEMFYDEYQVLLNRVAPNARLAFQERAGPVLPPGAASLATILSRGPVDIDPQENVPAFADYPSEPAVVEGDVWPFEDAYPFGYEESP